MGPELSSCRLYGIVDLGYVSATDARRVAEKMIDGGVDILQLRAKDHAIASIIPIVRDLLQLTSAADRPLVVNDYAEVARELAVEGVHVGQDDLPIARVREVRARSIIVGKSTHSIKQARAAQAEGADYIGFGPIFPTPTKPDYEPIGLKQIRQVHAELTLPIFCIGGIKIENLQSVIDAGAKRVVIVSGLLQARDIVEYARSAKDMLASKSEIRNPKSETSSND